MWRKRELSNAYAIVYSVRLIRQAQASFEILRTRSRAIFQYSASNGAKLDDLASLCWDKVHWDVWYLA